MLELYRIEFKEISDSLLRRIAKSTFEMTIFQLQPLLKQSSPSINNDSIPKEKMFYFTGNLVFMYPNGWWFIRKMEEF